MIDATWMKPKGRYLSFLLLWFFLCDGAVAVPTSSASSPAAPYPAWVISANMGYGSSDWEYMVGQDVASQASTPSSVNEDGLSGGLSIAYRLNPYFRWAFNYTKFSNSQLNFLFPSLIDINLMSIETATESYALEAQLTHAIFHSSVYGFSGIGLGFVHRKDLSATYSGGGPAGSGYTLQNKSRLGGAFSAGLGRDLSNQFNAEMGFQYLTGFAKSESEPVDDYIPFTYYAYVQLGYII